jgi:hypothetical protein
MAMNICQYTKLSDQIDPFKTQKPLKIQGLLRNYEEKSLPLFTKGLLHQHHFLYLFKRTCVHLIEIDTACNCFAEAVFAIPCCTVCTGIMNVVDDRCNFLTENVEDGDFNIAASRTTFR